MAERPTGVHEEEAELLSAVEMFTEGACEALEGIAASYRMKGFWTLEHAQNSVLTTCL